MSKRNAYIFGGAAVLLVSAFFVANVPLKPAEWPISLCAILGFSAPVVIATVQWMGKRRAAVLLAALGLYALLFETAAIKAGWPYGHFHYGDLLGPLVFNAAPYSVLVAWTPLVLGVVALRLGKRWRGLLYAVVAVIVLDVVLDPAAVYLGFWHWDQPGAYYGVPLQNFFGWFVSGTIALVGVYAYTHRYKLFKPPLLLAYNLLGIVVFWSLVNAFAAQYVPAILGLVVASAIAYRCYQLKMV